MKEREIRQQRIEENFRKLKVLHGSKTKNMSLIEYCFIFRDSIIIRIRRGDKYHNIPLSSASSSEILEYLLEWEKAGITEPHRLISDPKD